MSNPWDEAADALGKFIDDRGRGEQDDLVRYALEAAQSWLRLKGEETYVLSEAERVKLGNLWVGSQK